MCATCTGIPTYGTVLLKIHAPDCICPQAVQLVQPVKVDNLAGAWGSKN